MAKNKNRIKWILALGVLGVVGYLMMKKKKGEGKLGAPADIPQGDNITPLTPAQWSHCINVEDSTGKQKGKWISTKGKYQTDEGTKNRKIANNLKVGSEVQFRDAKPAKVIKLWRDKSGDVGAFQVNNPAIHLRIGDIKQGYTNMCWN